MTLKNVCINNHIEYIESRIYGNKLKKKRELQLVTANNKKIRQQQQQQRFDCNNNNNNKKKKSVSKSGTASEKQQQMKKNNNNNNKNNYDLFNNEEIIDGYLMPRWPLYGNNKIEKERDDDCGGHHLQSKVNVNMNRNVNVNTNINYDEEVNEIEEEEEEDHLSITSFDCLRSFEYTSSSSSCKNSLFNNSNNNSDNNDGNGNMDTSRDRDFLEREFTSSTSSSSSKMKSILPIDDAFITTTGTGTETGAGTTIMDDDYVVRKFVLPVSASKISITNMPVWDGHDHELSDEYVFSVEEITYAVQEEIPQVGQHENAGSSSFGGKNNHKTIPQSSITLSSSERLLKCLDKDKDKTKVKKVKKEKTKTSLSKSLKNNNNNNNNNGSSNDDDDNNNNNMNKNNRKQGNINSNNKRSMALTTTSINNPARRRHTRGSNSMCHIIRKGHQISENDTTSTLSRTSSNSSSDIGVTVTGNNNDDENESENENENENINSMGIEVSVSCTNKNEITTITNSNIEKKKVIKKTMKKLTNKNNSSRFKVNEKNIDKENVNVMIDGGENNIETLICWNGIIKPQTKIKSKIIKHNNSNNNNDNDEIIIIEKDDMKTEKKKKKKNVNNEREQDFDEIQNIINLGDMQIEDVYDCYMEEDGEEEFMTTQMDNNNIESENENESENEENPWDTTKDSNIAIQNFVGLNNNIRGGSSYTHLGKPKRIIHQQKYTSASKAKAIQKKNNKKSTVALGHYISKSLNKTRKSDPVSMYQNMMNIRKIHKLK